jgi:hypothetical protein
LVDIVVINNEAFTLSDAFASQVDFAPLIAELMTLLDTPIARGWFRIDDSQTVVWQAADNSQSVTWQQIGDEQNPNWTVINNTQE